MKNQDQQKVWFITGASKGLGLELVKQLLALGHKVAATSRNAALLKEAVNTESGFFLPLEANITQESSVKEAITTTIQAFGNINVVINNAGYGIGGSLEELTDNEVRDSFDVNLFAAINIIRHVLPYMRSQRSGHIMNISSIAGISANAGWAVYAGAKFALVGITEVLAEDIKEFGITATVVAPGAFRTSFLTEESLYLPQQPIEEYQAVRSSHSKYLNMNGAQAGDPVKAATVMINTATLPNPPLHLFLGSDAYRRGTIKTETLKQSIEASKETAISTDLTTNS